MQLVCYVCMKKEGNSYTPTHQIMAQKREKMND